MTKPACTKNCECIFHMTGGRHATDCPAYDPGCPTCGSPRPELHPSPPGGHPLRCKDKYHGPTVREKVLQAVFDAIGAAQEDLIEQRHPVINRPAIIKAVERAFDECGMPEEPPA